MWPRAARAALGVIAAFLVFELFLVPLSSAYPPPTPNVAADSLAQGVVTRRQIEGIPDGAYQALAYAPDHPRGRVVYPPPFDEVG